MALSHIPSPLLPPPPSWYPGHMAKFARMLPALLSRTDIVLELRDSRLPLTSINNKLEGALQQWRAERGCSPSPTYTGPTTCERIVVLNKRDLVPEWGMEPFQKAMKTKFPDQRVIFASWNRPRDIRNLNELLVSIAKSHPETEETNVLVMGMPNVGKSTLLNALRNVGIPGPTPKAFQTSAHPGLTRVLSTRLKLSESPRVYSYDSPGVMVPFFGRGDRGAERGVKLALIAGIKEGMYDAEVLAGYLLYRLNVLNPIAPVYLQVLPPGTPPTVDVLEFLDTLARRLGMLKRGGERDMTRAAVWFVKWWREEGGLVSATAPDASDIVIEDGGMQQRRGWGFDFEWTVGPGECVSVQEKMEECIEKYLVDAREAERGGDDVSMTQVKNRILQEKLAKRKAKQRARRAR